jgi:hypothetical protein
MPPVLASLPALVVGGLLDPQLAGLAWLLLERGVPVLVAGADPGAAAPLVDALAGALPADRRPDGVAHAHDRLVRVSEVLGPTTPAGPLRVALGRTTGRSGLQALVEARDLAGVLDVLARQGLSDDEISFLGVVLVVERRREVEDEPRVVVAHYLRPLVRDAGGHDRRQRPAVLASWDPGADRWEDFAWGIGPDLAERCRMPAREFEVERERRSTVVAEHAAILRAGPGLRA